MERTEIIKTMRRFAIRSFLLLIAIILVINASYLLMTWLILEVFEVKHIYLSSEFQFLGTLAIALTFVIIFFILTYQRRKRELTTLSENIEKVANGDFSARIRYKPRDPMAHIYRDFNKMSSELESVQVLRNDFINSFSHEFKTPIASINGFASLMLDRNISREDQQMYLTIIKEESDRLSRLTSNAILITKLTSQKVISDREVYDLGEQIRQCSILLSQEWLKKKQEFEGDFPHVDFSGNRELMQHVWLNLIGNAVKYTPSGGEISVKLQRLRDSAIVTVSDTGEGMSEETLKHIFDPYYQGDSSHSRQGLGIGLSIVQRIVAECGGTIEVSSRLQEGSCFTVRLPLGKNE